MAFLSTVRQTVAKWTPLQKLLVIVSLLTVFCCLATDCVLCKFWPISWKKLHGIESFVDSVGAVALPPTLTLYYADWCPFSKEFMPVWEKVKQGLLGTQTKVVEVDIDADPAAAKDAKISSYPTVLFLKNGIVTEYTGELTEGAIRKFIELM